MPIGVREFIDRLDSTQKAVRRCKSPQLQSKIRRQEIQELVDDYFKKLRPSLAQDSEQTTPIRASDYAFQQLLSLSHRSALVSKYIGLLKKSRSALVQLDSHKTSQTKSDEPSHISDLDKRIVSTLSKLVPSAALSYEQAVTDLSARGRLSWRGQATDLRESLRETLDYLAPDKDVMKTDGFKLEAGASGPTMKQKVRFILRKRGASKTASSTSESAVECIESALGSFVRSVYVRSSASAHTPSDKTEVVRVRDLVRVALCELLEIRE